MNRQRSDAGFTLLEVMVAILILSMSLAVIFPMLGSGPGRLIDDKNSGLAMRIAESKLAETIVIANWDAMPIEDDDENWAWRMEAAPYDTPDPDAVSSYPMLVTAAAWSKDAPDTIRAQLQRIVWVVSE